MSTIDMSLMGFGSPPTCDYRDSEPQPVRISGGSYLSREEIEGIRQDLLDQRAKLLADIARMQNETPVSSDATNSAEKPPLRDPSDTDHRDQAWERNLRQRAIASKRSLLYEIDQALERIANHTYGICPISQKTISIDRLREIPWARSV